LPIPKLPAAVRWPLLALLSLVRTEASDAAPQRSPATTRPRGEALFAAALHGALRHQTGNLAYSPTSLRLAMSLAAAGARGETLAQLRRGLGLPDDTGATDAEVRALFASWDALAMPTGYDPEASRMSLPSEEGTAPEERERQVVTLRVANRVWVDQKTRLQPEYSRRLAEAYRAPVGIVDFVRAAEQARREINGWVSDQTLRKIPELLAPGTLSAETRLALTNAVYFKAQWAEPFSEAATRTEPFHLGGGKSVPASLMRQVETFRLAQVDGAQLLELPYGSGRVVMDLLLPTAPEGLPAIEAAYAERGLDPWLRALSSQRVDVVLPKWRSDSSLELGKTLAALGMPLPFRFPGADFSGIDGTQLLYIGLVIHKALVEVDERGTVAAAATAVLARAGGRPAEPARFRADHPFLYFLRDTATGAILFAGRVANPTSR
jgi:serpin B